VPQNWIQNAIGKRGALHEDLGIPKGQKIPRSVLEQAAQGNGTTAKRARLALTLEGMHHGRARKKKKPKVRKKA
jgi:hypothetical protein